MVFNININKKGMEASPFRGKSFGIIGIGPQMKYLLIPNELATKLVMNVIRGRA